MTAKRTGRLPRVGRLAIAILAMMCCAEAHAQSRSRADVQFGAVLLDTVTPDS